MTTHDKPDRMIDVLPFSTALVETIIAVAEHREHAAIIAAAEARGEAVPSPQALARHGMSLASWAAMRARRWKGETP